jgi:hypothetical protein
MQHPSRISSCCKASHKPSDPGRAGLLRARDRQLIHAAMGLIHVTSCLTVISSLDFAWYVLQAGKFTNIAPHRGRGSVVGVANRCDLGDRESNPGAGEVLRTRPDRPGGPTSLLYNGYCVFFPGVKWLGHSAKNLLHVASRLKKQ